MKLQTHLKALSRTLLVFLTNEGCTFQLNFAVLSVRVGFDPFCVTGLVPVSSINSLMPGRETQTA